MSKWARLKAVSAIAETALERSQPEPTGGSIGSYRWLIYVMPALDFVVAIAASGAGAGGRDLINRIIIPALQRHGAP